MSYDCEIPEFYSETFPKARKVYHCCECSAPIRIGEEHLYWRSKFDGVFDCGRQHMACRELCMHMNAESDDGCCAFGQMKDSFTDGDWHLKDQPVARTLMARVLRRERAAARARTVAR